ncbi:serine/threonine-protein kinase [Streptomyces gilvus]|uniref:serine/threonine-protein kinase n=1 Tax=Streptomyces gilvus TaxID=2920937 RepID=UPI001F10664A|nr:serine/threonine-protein kinase [Streptomyces sp. CME 23]MCH5672579.1 protein kinase [Streptomyces sp. CME 23]
MGEVFAGRYELVDPIGRGGVGAVWRAWDHRRRRYVAAKVLQQSDAHSLLRFVREQALRIDHPHVLAPASWAADDDKVLFTMDLVAGGSLVHLIGDYGPLPPAFVCTLLDQLLSGLAAVHAEDVVHRDIKPANVLLEATGTGRPRLRLSDFGIAMRLGEPRLTETNLVVGTPGYLAPEQMMGAEPDFPADLFAVGLVALYLLEGAKPDTKALVEYFAAHGTPSAPKSVPEPLWQVVATLLQPDPRARFRTATGARKALAAARELLPEPGPDDELIEIFDQIGPLPPGFAAEGPLKPAPGVEVKASASPGDSSSTPGTGSRPSGPGDGSVPPASDAISVSPGPDAGSISPGSGAGSVPSGPGTDSVPTVARTTAVPATGVAPPAPPVDPRRDTGSQPPSAVPAQPPGMSDTGSFHLPPPQATVTSAASPRTPAPRTPSAPQPPPPVHEQPQGQTPQGGQPYPAHVSAHDPTHVLSSPRAVPPAPHLLDDASTASYTAQDRQVPPSAQEIPPHLVNGVTIAPHPVDGVAPGTARRGHRAARRARRPGGPPAKVALPLLLFALVSYAVGFWALTRV